MALLVLVVCRPAAAQRDDCQGIRAQLVSHSNWATNRSKCTNGYIEQITSRVLNLARRFSFESSTEAR